MELLTGIEGVSSRPVRRREQRDRGIESQAGVASTTPVSSFFFFFTMLNCQTFITFIAPLRHSRSGESTGGYATGANISPMGGALEEHARRCRWPVRGPSSCRGYTVPSSA